MTVESYPTELSLIFYWLINVIIVINLQQQLVLSFLCKFTFTQWAQCVQPSVNQVQRRLQPEDPCISQWSQHHSDTVTWFSQLSLSTVQVLSSPAVNQFPSFPLWPPPHLCLLSFALVFMLFFDCLKFCSVYICGCCTKRNEKKPF